MRRPLTVLVVLAATACSLPLSRDIHAVRAVEAQRRQSGDIQVLPPGPKPGATPEDVVQGFLGAEANAESGHAIARQFLTAPEAVAWRDGEEVQVYDPDRAVDIQRARSGSSDRVTVEVTAFVSGRVRADGAYAAQVPAKVTERYVLQRVQGQWRLTDVPNGLRLTSADLNRAYRPSGVYYLATDVGDSPPHLVPDQVFLPVGTDDVGTLVRRLLAQPSAALRGSVTSAFPADTRLRSAAINTAGVVTVDLDVPLAEDRTAALQAMSAQLVWTLRGLGPAFTGLRLLRNGSPLAVPTVGRVQDAGDWASFDPDGLGTSPPYYFVGSRRLRAQVSLPPGPATAGGPADRGAIPVDAVAVSPDRTQYALLARGRGGAVVVRTGPLRGPYTTGRTVTGLSSPTWGSAQYGLWLLQDGRQVVLLRPGSTDLQQVTVLGQPAGRLQALAMSRDGARAALVIAGQLWVGRIEVVGGMPRIVSLTVVLPTLSAVTAVAWSSATELAVLGTVNRPAQVLRVAVDGSSVTALSSSGLTPTTVAASPAGLIVESGTGLYLAGRGFSRVQDGALPVYPG
jgi:hypothetical protein